MKKQLIQTKKEMFREEHFLYQAINPREEPTAELYKKD
jgi:hypothetical protein